MNFKIIGDSCCDFTDYDGGLKWLTRVPLFIDIGDKHYVDTASLNVEELLAEMASSPEAPKSACPSPGAYLDAFRGDYDGYFVVTLSKELSGSYMSALDASVMAAAEGKRVHVFNSKSAAAGEIAVCIKIRELCMKGLDFDDIISETEAFIETMNTYFVLETLEVFRKNGRLNHLQALVTSALKLKLVMKEENGNVAVAGKALSVKSALLKMIDKIRESLSDSEMKKRNLVITQCSCPERAESVKKLIMSKCPFKAAIICRAGGLSTVYANSGGIIVSY